MNARNHSVCWAAATALVCIATQAAQAEPAAHTPPEAVGVAAPVSGRAWSPSEAPAEHAPVAAGHGHASEQAKGAHAGSGQHGSAEPPRFDQINWVYGFLGEREQTEPSLLYRPKGMPSPFVATLINWGVLVSLIVMLAKKQIPTALAKRKAGIVQGMNDAQKARDESATLLSEYERKLATIDQDIERIKSEMKRAGEQERERILAEAVERRTRMERDARRLIETEIESAKEELRREVVKSALSSARQSIEDKLAASDQQRLFDEAIASLKKLPARSLGGQQV